MHPDEYRYQPGYWVPPNARTSVWKPTLHLRPVPQPTSAKVASTGATPKEPVPTTGSSTSCGATSGAVPAAAMPPPPKPPASVATNEARPEVMRGFAQSGHETEFWPNERMNAPYHLQKKWWQAKQFEAEFDLQKIPTGPFIGDHTHRDAALFGSETRISCEGGRPNVPQIMRAWTQQTMAQARRDRIKLFQTGIDGSTKLHEDEDPKACMLLDPMVIEQREEAMVGGVPYVARIRADQEAALAS